MVREKSAEHPHFRLVHREPMRDRAREFREDPRAILHGGEHFRLPVFRGCKNDGRQFGDRHFVGVGGPAHQLAELIQRERAQDLRSRVRPRDDRCRSSTARSAAPAPQGCSRRLCRRAIAPSRPPFPTRPLLRPCTAEPVPAITQIPSPSPNAVANPESASLPTITCALRPIFFHQRAKAAAVGFVRAAGEEDADIGHVCRQHAEHLRERSRR